MSAKVDFFIVGAMKSGTSSLRDMLRQHPGVDMWRGEIHYFDNPALFAKGEDWYHGHFDFTREGVLHGDKSPSYSLDPGTPAKLAAYNPAARLVWILRNPARRLVSNYHHSKRRKPEALSIEDSLQNAETLAARNSPMAYLYRSQYDRHLQAFLPHFAAERHHVLIFEELIADPGSHIGGLTEWLGLDANVPLEFPHSNENRPMVKRRYPVAPEVVDRVHDLLSPTVEYIERFLGRPIPKWRAP